MVHDVYYGKRRRKSYSRIPEVLELPDLIAVQKKSYEWFITEGLRDVFDDISPIIDYSDTMSLEFVDYYLEDNPKYSEQEAKERDGNYATPLKIKARLINKETFEVKEQEVFMGDFPLMTEKGTFIINGAERVIVNQLVRSPGPYYHDEIDKSGNRLFSATIIPNRGAWIEYDSDSNGVVNVRIDRTRKLPATTLVRALLLETDEDMRDVLGDSKYLNATLEKEVSRTREEALIEIYKKLKPGDPAALESAIPLINNLLFDPKRYDLARVGRYKFNKKLSVCTRITGHTSADDIVDRRTGELLCEQGEVITRETAQAIEDAGVNLVVLQVGEERVHVVGNEFVRLEAFDLPFDGRALGLSEKVFYPEMRALLDEHEGNDKELEQKVKEHVRALSPRHITKSDILATVSYELNLFYGIGNVDDIDHLGNRRVRSVGELLQNQFRIGMSRMERVVKERMSTQDSTQAQPTSLINIRPVSAAIKEFFGSSQLSQFMDQTNPLSELTHKRRMSALGPGGLSRDRAGYEVRDVHHSHYGRICPIETPEGPNIGLITSMTTYSRINEYGFIETPFRVMDKENLRVTNNIEYLTADEEDHFVVAQANEPLDEEGHFVNDRVSGRGINGENDIYQVQEIDYMDVSPQQIVAVGTAMIPFLENDDATRALMGANMQRQAVPLLKTESPIIGTGIEYKAAYDSGVVLIAKNDGTVIKVAADQIRVRRFDDNGIDEYQLMKFKRSNQGTTINQRAIVQEGEVIRAGDVIADGPSTELGEIALGKNVLVAFMTWEGYNFEDAILINEKLVVDDSLTSVHIEEHESEARDTKLGPEEITPDIPNVSDDMRKYLDEHGVIMVGAEVKANDILVGKVTPKGETELSAEERLLRAIFGEKAREVRDTSLRVPHGESGIVVDVKRYSRENGDEMSPGVNEVVRVYVATKRKISVGDKLCGRHGNKGVVSRILPEEDMPFLPDGRAVDVVLNPLGVPSRMNLGQVLEVHLGMAAKKLGWHVATPVFDGASDHDIIETLELAGYPASGKVKLRDGRTGDPFDNDVTVGYMYLLKLHHLVDEKIHARSIGPYSLVTQQPLGGKAQFGGQRFGEMEVWALEAYGASHMLQEMLTVKSDDIVGRVKSYESIVKGENIPQPGIPESFKVLIKELQSLSLDIKVLTEDEQEVEFRESDDDMYDYNQIDQNMDKDQMIVTDIDERSPFIIEEIDDEDEADTFETTAE